MPIACAVCRDHLFRTLHRTLIPTGRSAPVPTSNDADMLKLLTHRHLDDRQPPSLPHATIPHGARDAEAGVAHLKSVPVKQQPLSRFLSDTTRCAKSVVPALMSWVVALRGCHRLTANRTATKRTPPLPVGTPPNS